jgi:hypothetical protein
MKVSRSNERGGARLKFLIVMIIIAAVAYAGYIFVPVAYQAYLFKDLMQHYVDVAAAQGYQPSWVGDQLTKSLPEYDIPRDATITPTQQDNRVEVRVQFTRALELPGYTYQYEFDHTARSTPFISTK